MRLMFDNGTREILAHGIIFLPSEGCTLVDMDDGVALPFLEQIGHKYLNPDGTISVTPPKNPDPPLTPVTTPNIVGLVQALTKSPSIDQPTKNALITALEGQ